MVSRTGAKDKPAEVAVTYLPDLTRPQYAVMRPGFGSSKLALTFSNGVLMSTSAETDPKITELITALAGVPGSLATAAKTRAEAAQIRAEASDFPAAANALRAVAQDIAAIASSSDATTYLTASQRLTLGNLPQELNSAAAQLDNPATNETNVEPILKSLKQTQEKLSAIKPAGEPGDQAKPFWNRVATVQAALDAAIGKLSPKEEPKSEVTLYEVIMDGNGARLREVPVEAAKH